MHSEFLRTEMLFGEDAMKLLASSKVAVFGIGGVGGYAAEALVRSGLGSIDIIDNDKVGLTNINRQIYALHSTIGQYKVDVAKNRILDINPNINIQTHKVFYAPDTADKFDFSQYNYIVDAIDTVTGKIELIEQANKAETLIISSMGAGNKTDPTMFEVDDIYNTSVCPLARVMRQELKKRKIPKLKVVYSKEFPIKINLNNYNFAAEGSNKRFSGSNAFVPSVAGLIIASEVIKDLINYKKC